MQKPVLSLLALSALAAAGYWAWQKYPDQVASWKSAGATVTRKPDLPATAVVATRDINFAVTAAIGGVAGLLASKGLVNLLSLLSPGDNTPVITVNAMLLASGFSVCVGILAGLFPGFKAARLNPIQALRYE